MMHAAALMIASSLSHPTDVVPALRTSINNYALEVIPNVDSGVSLWGGDVVFRNEPPPALDGATIHQSWGLAAPTGSPFRTVCETPPCDIYVAVYNNLCDGEEKQNSLLGHLDSRGWDTLPCVLFSETTVDGTEVRLPIKHAVQNTRVLEFPLTGPTSRVLVFIRPQDPNAPVGSPCPPKPSGPFSPVSLQQCPGLPVFPENALQPASIARVIQVEQDGVLLSEDVEPFVGLSTLPELISADQYGNVNSGFELDQAAVIAFYQQADSESVALVWVNGKDERAAQTGDKQRISAVISGYPADALKYSSELAFAKFEGGNHRFNAVFPVERSVGVAFESSSTVESEVTVNIGTYDLQHGVYLRVPTGVIPIDSTKPFKIITKWL